MSPPTEVAGRYVIERRLGAGGMSTVFLARDTVLERPVAVKLLAEHLADDEAFVYRFQREALSAARLQHPNIVQVFDSGQDPASHRHYIVMEYVDGPSAADMLRERKQLGIEETGQLVRDACHGLDYAHRAGVVHRDVKPGNLLLRGGDGHHEARRLRDREGRRADAHHPGGIGARHGGVPVARAGARRGGGAGLRHLLARRVRVPVPHRAASARVRLAHRAGAEAAAGARWRRSRDYRPEVPPELDHAVRVALERDPSARYSSALEMAEAIEAGLRGEGTDATQVIAQTDDTAATRAMQRTTVGPRPRASSRRRPRAAVEPARPRRSEREAARASARRRRFGSFLALLAALAAIAVVAVALLSSSGGDSVDPVDGGDVQGQIDGLRDFIEEHSR